jgi:hypothetical protein
MNDYRNVLERDLARVGPAPFDFDDVARRRDRKRRNQRIAAGVVGIAVFVAAIWFVTSFGSFDRTQTPAVPGGSETGTMETGPSVAPNPAAEVLGGLPPEGATPSTPESGELVVELANQVWLYADGRVISSVYDLSLEPYSGLVEQHLTPEGVEFLRSNVLSTGLFEHDLELASRDNPNCCLDIRVRDGDRLVSVRLGPRYALSDHQAPIASPEQETALRSLEALLTSPTSWPASVWTDQQIRAYVPTSYSFCSRFVEPSHVLALLPEPARDLLGAKYLKADGDGFPQPTCSRMTTEDARALAGILAAEFGHGRGLLGFSSADPEVPGRSFLIAMNPVLPHGAWAWLAGLG